MEYLSYTGKGVGVAVLDTGIFPHMDFRNRIHAFADFVAYKSMPYDDNGHGTHVAGILAGDGTASMGKYKGVAPGCGLTALKVLDRFGNGSREQVLRAFRWILDHREQYRIRIVNISVGTTCRSVSDQDILIQGVEKALGRRLVVVARRGQPRAETGKRYGSGKQQEGDHGRFQRYADRKDCGFRLRSYGECVCKPDLVAPGNHIVSCAPGTANTYGVKSGTSMSTPLVSGAIALMLEKDPLLTNVEIKMLLRESTDDMGLPVTGRDGESLIFISL